MCQLRLALKHGIRHKHYWSVDVCSETKTSIALELLVEL